MADRAELLNAMRVIQGYCRSKGYSCEGCEIYNQCNYFQEEPASWDLEDGEENEG